MDGEEKIHFPQCKHCFQISSFCCEGFKHVFNQDCRSRLTINLHGPKANASTLRFLLHMFVYRSLCNEPKSLCHSLFVNRSWICLFIAQCTSALGSSLFSLCKLASLPNVFVIRFLCELILDEFLHRSWMY